MRRACLWTPHGDGDVLVPVGLPQPQAAGASNYHQYQHRTQAVLPSRLSGRVERTNQ